MATERPNARMNWDLSQSIAYDGTRTPLKSTLFIVLCLAWVLPGLVGHDPWKYDEAVVFGAVTEMLRSHDWLAFSVAGEPTFERAPLFFWVAAAFAKVFGLVLPLHDAARLAVGFFMAATLALLSAASYELEGTRGVRLSVLLFLGCLGLLIRAHEMSTDLAGLTGVALGLYGIALASRRPWLGGVLTGAGVGMAFLGDGFLPVGVLAALMVALPATSPFWRTRSYATSMAIAAVVAAPLLAVWPVALTTVSPVALHKWMASATSSRWTDGFGQGDFLELLYFVRILPWYAWPAWPLAAWALWKGRRNLAARRDLMLPLVSFAAFFVVISVFGEARDVNALPLLLPLALLGAAEVDTLPRGAASALDWFGMTTFGDREPRDRRAMDRPRGARLPPQVQFPRRGARRAPHAHLARGGREVVALDAPRARELGGRDHDGMDADDDARPAAGRPRSQLSRDLREDRRRVAAELPLHRAPQPGRRAARAPRLLRQHPHDTR